MIFYLQFHSDTSYIKEVTGYTKVKEYKGLQECAYSSYAIIKWHQAVAKLLLFMINAKTRHSTEGNGTMRIAVSTSICNTFPYVV
jgi:hypothetical protein